jgi:hypothetical protein
MKRKKTRHYRIHRNRQGMTPRQQLDHYRAGLARLRLAREAGRTISRTDLDTTLVWLGDLFLSALKAIKTKMETQLAGQPEKISALAAIIEDEQTRTAESIETAVSHCAAEDGDAAPAEIFPAVTGATKNRKEKTNANHRSAARRPARRKRKTENRDYPAEGCACGE